MSKSTSGLSSKGADFFLVKFWTQMLDNPDCRHVCEWAPDGRHLIIYDPDGLMAEIKSRGVCKQKDYDSFARQLRIYRWGRVKADECGVSPLPPTVKVWRHPRLVCSYFIPHYLTYKFTDDDSWLQNRDSPLVEVANVTRNAPPKPNKAEKAAGLPEKSESKQRKKATEGYIGSSSESRQDEDEQHQREGSNIPIAQAHASSPVPQQSTPAVTANVDIPVHASAHQVPPANNLPPLMPPQVASNNERPVQRLPPAYSRPTSTASTSAAIKYNKAPSKKKQTIPTYSSTKPAFDVETSIFDPNNNFGILSARPLHSYAGQAHRSYNLDEISSDSSMSSDEEADSLFLNDGSSSGFGQNGTLNNRAVSNLAKMSIASMPSLSTPQVVQAFLTKVNYDNAAIEQAAQNPASYDRPPWPLPPATTSPSSSNIQVEPLTQNNPLASFESRLQTISESIKAADVAVAQYVR